jgi:hypothetical protein
MQTFNKPKLALPAVLAITYPAWGKALFVQLKQNGLFSVLILGAVLSLVPLIKAKQMEVGDAIVLYIGYGVYCSVIFVIAMLALTGMA